MGIFDGLFDVNRDGKADFVEKVFGMATVMAALDDDEEQARLQALCGVGNCFADDVDEAFEDDLNGGKCGKY